MARRRLRSLLVLFRCWTLVRSVSGTTGTPRPCAATDRDRRIRFEVCRFLLPRRLQSGNQRVSDEQGLMLDSDVSFAILALRFDLP